MFTKEAANLGFLSLAPICPCANNQRLLSLGEDRNRSRIMRRRGRPAGRPHDPAPRENVPSTDSLLRLSVRTLTIIAGALIAIARSASCAYSQFVRGYRTFGRSLCERVRARYLHGGRERNDRWELRQRPRRLRKAGTHRLPDPFHGNHDAPRRRPVAAARGLRQCSARGRLCLPRHGLRRSVKARGSTQGVRRFARR